MDGGVEGRRDESEILSPDYADAITQGPTESGSDGTHKHFPRNAIFEMTLLPLCLSLSSWGPLLCLSVPSDPPLRFLLIATKNRFLF